jgi:hypothetical protein
MSDNRMSNKINQIIIFVFFENGSHALRSSFSKVAWPTKRLA